MVVHDVARQASADGGRRARCGGSRWRLFCRRFWRRCGRSTWSRVAARSDREDCSEPQHAAPQRVPGLSQMDRPLTSVVPTTPASTRLRHLDGIDQSSSRCFGLRRDGPIRCKGVSSTRTWCWWLTPDDGEDGFVGGYFETLVRLLALYLIARRLGMWRRGCGAIDGRELLFEHPGRRDGLKVESGEGRGPEICPCAALN